MAHVPAYFTARPPVASDAQGTAETEIRCRRVSFAFRPVPVFPFRSLEHLEEYRTRGRRPFVTVHPVDRIMRHFLELVTELLEPVGEWRFYFEVFLFLFFEVFL